MKYAGQTGGITDCALIAGQQRSLYEDRKTTVGIPRNTATSAAIFCAAMRTGNGGVLPLSLLNNNGGMMHSCAVRHCPDKAGELQVFCPKHKEQIIQLKKAMTKK